MSRSEIQRRSAFEMTLKDRQAGTLTVFHDDDQLINAFATILQMFVRDDGIPTKDLQVLSHRSAEKSLLWKHRSFRRHRPHRFPRARAQ